MTSQRHPSINVILLSIVVILAGSVCVTIAVAKQVSVTQPAWLMMIAMVLLVAPMGVVKIPNVTAKIVLGDVVTFGCMALFGTSAAVIAATVDGAAASLRITKSPLKFFYNVSTCAVSMTVAGYVATRTFPGFGSQQTPLSMSHFIGAMGLFALCYFAISTMLVAGFIAAMKGEHLLKLWRESFLWTSVSYLASGVFASASFALVGQFGYYIFLAAGGMMLLVSTFYRTYFQKVETANNRAESMEELNYHTIEALVTAIGAVGYGVKSNVRRVEYLAKALGEAAGCSADELKALRIAALFHDVGNVAGQQRMLTKPTELSSKEIEKIKLHASAGARLAKVIGFSPAVAEIIQYHHERFDGTGYPDSLKGEQIPLGARVLTIVDCYNALTLDHPYRPRLSRQDAVEALKKHAGSAFDPAILSKFLDLVASADEEACRAQSAATDIDELQTEFLYHRLNWQAAKK